jgi:hypothetical protein
MDQHWYAPLMGNDGVDGPSLSNSTAATSILPVNAKRPIPGGFLKLPGEKLRLRLAGRLSNIVTTPGTLQIQLKFGSTVVYDTGAIQLSTTAHTTLPFALEADLELRTPGNAAALFGMGRAWSQCIASTAVADSTYTHASLMVPNSTPAVGNTFDSTAQQIVDVVATFSIANAANLFQLHLFGLDSAN